MPVDIQFLERALRDEEAARRLAGILEQAAGPGTEAQIYGRIRQALMSRAQGILYGSFPRFAGEFTPESLMKEFYVRLDRIMAERRPVTTPEEFFRRACREFCNILLDHARQSSRRARLLEEHAPDLPVVPRPPDDPAEDVADLEQMERLREAVRRLDPVDESIFTYRLGGMTLEAIGRQVGMPTSTVHHRLLRITAGLRAAVEDGNAAGDPPGG